MVHSSRRELATFMPWASSEYSLADAETWVAGELGDVHRFVIVDRAGQAVGTCALNRFDESNRSANLGYWLDTAHTGKGCATAAASMLATFGLTPATDGGAGLARVEIRMSTRNDASRRVAERAGAVFEGTLRKSLLLRDGLHDAHLYSIVEGDR